MTRYTDELPEAEVPWDHCVDCGDAIYHKPRSFLAPRCRWCEGMKYGGR